MTSASVTSLPNFARPAQSTDELPRELAELQAKALAAEVEAVARWTFDARLADMGETAAVFDAKRRASRWSNDQPRKYRKVAYLFGFVVSYSTHGIDASWPWLAKRYKQIHKETIAPRTLRRLAKELAALGLLEITENKAENHVACNCFRCEHPGAQLWNTYTLHCGLAVRNDGTLVRHNWNAPLAETMPKALSAECEHCGGGFDPKRQDARYCSERCRKAASRERVTDNDHRVDQGVDHRVGHPSQLGNSYENTCSSSPLRGACDDDADDVFSGEELPSSRSVVAEEDLPRPKASWHPAPGSSAERDEEGDLWEDVIRHSNATRDLHRRALVKRAERDGLDISEVEAALINLMCGHLEGFDPERMGPGAVMDFLVEIVGKHREWEAGREEREAERAEREAQAEARAAEEERLAQEQAAQAAEQERLASEEAARLAAIEERCAAHRAAHPDHYPSCGSYQCPNCDRGWHERCRNRWHAPVTDPACEDFAYDVCR